jgi:hypothetical protein
MNIAIIKYYRNSNKSIENKRVYVSLGCKTKGRQALMHRMNMPCHDVSLGIKSPRERP